MQIALDAGIRVGTPTGFGAQVGIGLVIVVIGIVLLIVGNRRKPQFGPPGSQPVKSSSGLRGLGIGAVIVGGLLFVVQVSNVEPAPPGVAGRLVLPATAGGLPKVATPERVLQDPGLVKGMKIATYAHPKSKAGGPSDLVYFYGSEGVFVPETVMKQAFSALAAKVQATDTVHSYAAGTLGGLVRCESFGISGETEVHCFWADTETVGHLVAGRLTEREAADLLVKMRSDLEPPR